MSTHFSKTFLTVSNGGPVEHKSNIRHEQISLIVDIVNAGSHRLVVVDLEADGLLVLILMTVMIRIL